MLQPRKPVSGYQVSPENLVELPRVEARMILAIPPEPVRALGGEDLGIGLWGHSALQLSPHLSEIPPGPVFLLASYPCGKVLLDPAPWKHPGKALSLHLYLFEKGEIDEAGFGQPAVKPPEEVQPTPGIVGPGIFAVEHNGDIQLLSHVGLAQRPKVLEEISDGILRAHPVVHKSDPVRENPVPEEDPDAREFVGPQELFRRESLGPQAQLQAPLEYALIGSNPFHSGLSHYLYRLL